MVDDESESDVGLTYSGKPRTHGLRFSVLDGCVLVAAVVLTIATWSFTFGLSALIMFVVLHFFLFCNVFRIRRKPELIWATIFVVNCLIWISTGNVSMLGITISQAVITMLILFREVRLPYYHGIYAQTINPRLDEYIAGRV